MSGRDGDHRRHRADGPARLRARTGIRTRSGAGSGASPRCTGARARSSSRSGPSRGTRTSARSRSSPTSSSRGRASSRRRKEVAERIARGERGPFDAMQTIITMDPPKHRDAAARSRAPGSRPRPSGGSTRWCRRARGASSTGSTTRSRAARARCDFVDRGGRAAPAAHPLHHPRRRPRRTSRTSCASPRSSSPATTRSSSAPRRTARRRSGTSASSSSSTSARSSRTAARTRATTSPSVLANARVDGAADGRHRDPRLLPDHLHRRPRHDAQRDRRRHARAGRAPRAARGAAARIRPAAWRTPSRRSCAGRRR